MRIHVTASHRQQEGTFFHRFHVVDNGAIEHQTFAAAEIERPTVSMHPNMTE
jgi:hypothetical protein